MLRSVSVLQGQRRPRDIWQRSSEGRSLGRRATTRWPVVNDCRDHGLTGVHVVGLNLEQCQYSPKAAGTRVQAQSKSGLSETRKALHASLLRIIRLKAASGIQLAKKYNRKQPFISRIQAHANMHEQQGSYPPKPGIGRLNGAAEQSRKVRQSVNRDPPAVEQTRHHTRLTLASRRSLRRPLQSWYGLQRASEAQGEGFVTSRIWSTAQFYFSIVKSFTTAIFSLLAPKICFHQFCCYNRIQKIPILVGKGCFTVRCQSLVRIDSF